MKNRNPPRRDERGVSAAELIWIGIGVAAVSGLALLIFNLVRDTSVSLEQAMEGKIVYSKECDLQHAQPIARPLPYGLTEDAAGNQLLKHPITFISGNKNGQTEDYHYWEFPLSQPLDESALNAEMNMVLAGLTADNIKPTAQIDKFRFYNKWHHQYVALSVDPPQGSININDNQLTAEIKAKSRAAYRQRYCQNAD